MRKQHNDIARTRGFDHAPARTERAYETLPAARRKPAEEVQRQLDAAEQALAAITAVSMPKLAAAQTTEADRRPARELDGFRSRCSVPRSCAAWTASAIQSKEDEDHMGGIERKPGGSSLVDDASLGGSFSGGASSTPGKRTLTGALAPSTVGSGVPSTVPRKPGAGTASAPAAQADSDHAGLLIHLLTSSPAVAGDRVATYLNTLDTATLLATLSDTADCGYLPQLHARLSSARPFLVAALYAVELARVAPVAPNHQLLQRAGTALEHVSRDQQLQILAYLLRHRGVSIEATTLVEGVLAIRNGADLDNAAAAREPQPTGGGRGAADEAGATGGEEQAAGAAMGASIAGGAPAPISPGPWAPPGNQPGGLYVGNQAHTAIAKVYEAAHPADQVFTNAAPISSILKSLTNLAKKSSTKAKPDALAEDEQARRPDISNMTRRHLYEIKPATGQAEASATARTYLSIFEKAGVEMTLGPTTEPGTAGGLPAPAGVFMFQSPEPGVITYEYRKGRLVPVPVPRPEPATERRWRWELQPLTPMQKQAIVTTTVGGAMLIIMMIVLAPVGA